MIFFRRSLLLVLLAFIILGYTKAIGANDSTWVKTKKHPKLTITKLSGEGFVGKLMAFKLDSLCIVSAFDSTLHDLNEITYIRVDRSSNTRKGWWSGFCFGALLGCGFAWEPEYGPYGVDFKFNAGKYFLCALSGSLVGGIIGAINSTEKKIDFSSLSKDDKVNTISKLGGKKVRKKK
jgi:hypothetical protein